MYMTMQSNESPGKPPATDNWEAQLRKGCLELAILASLWEEPLYGLDILRALRTRSRMEVAEGTLYPILNRLRLDGTGDDTTEWRSPPSRSLGKPGRHKNGDSARTRGGQRERRPSPTPAAPITYVISMAYRFRDRN